MPPSKVLAQVEPEHVDGPPPEYADAPSCDEPAEVDARLLPRWMGRTQTNIGSSASRSAEGIPGSPSARL